MQEPRWRAFERLVAAIHKADAQGAQVTWNDRINGRQFDVTMRFQVGAYEYLTVIECKDEKKPVSVDLMEAFVTKSRDAGADKAVMASSAGFQEGALQVAERHCVEAFTVSRAEELPDDLLLEDLRPCLRIYCMRLLLRDSDAWLELPENRNLPLYLAKHLTFRSKDQIRTLDQVVKATYSQLLSSATTTEQRLELPLAPDEVVYLPHLVEEHPVSRFAFSYRIDSFRTPKHGGIDPHPYSGVYEYTNVRSGESRRIPKSQVAMRFDTILQPGRFYYNPELEYSYYCKDIRNGLATMILVESYQHGGLLQAVYEQRLEFQGQYVEVTEAKETERLRRVGRRILERHGAA